MRTPGRCTNFESCWMANGKRDVRVLVGDPFVCPACGGALQAPPLQAISANSMTGALAASVLLVATAGGVGFGVVRLARTASTATVAMLHPKAPATVVAQKASPAVGVARQDAPPETTALGSVRIAANPPRDYTSLRLAGSIPTLDLNPSVPAAIYVAAAPPHPLVLPISFGRPQPPEDDAPAQSARWHHRGARHESYGVETASAAPVAPASPLSPAPLSADDSAGFRQAQLGVPPAQGDGEADASAASPADSLPYATAGNAAADAPAMQGNVMPVQQASMSVPDAADNSAASVESAEPPAAMSRLIVPAVDRQPAAAGGQDVSPEDVTVYAPDGRVPEYQPAARVDPEEAAQVDRGPGGLYRLATLPAAPHDTLAKPAYPAREEAQDQPGRVDVDCVITVRGVPDGCAVQRQQGGHSFAHSVMNWLNSGSVRYRPTLVSGHPVAEPRDYRVNFVP